MSVIEVMPTSMIGVTSMPGVLSKEVHFEM